MLAHATWLAGQWGGAEHRTAIADAFILPNFLATAVLAWRTARHAALPAHVRRAWRWLTLAYALLWAGNVVWTYRDLVAGTGWLSAWGKVFIVASYGPLLAGLLSLPATARTRADRVRFGLDLATLLLGAGLVIGVVTYLAGGAPATPAEALDAFITPAADVAVVGAIAAVLLGRFDGASRRALRLLAAGHGLSVAAGVVAVWCGRDGSVVPGHWVDGLWMLSSALMFAAADAQSGGALIGAPIGGAPSADDAAPAPAASSKARGVSLLPYVGVGLAYALLFAVARPWWGRPAGVVVFGTAAVTALVVARQVLALRDNRRLAAERVAQDAYFRELIENSSDVVCVADGAGVARFVSASVERLFGYPVAAAQGGVAVRRRAPGRRGCGAPRPGPRGRRRDRRVRGTPRAPRRRPVAGGRRAGGAAAHGLRRLRAQRARRDRARGGRGRAGAAGVPRPAHRARQPGTVPRPRGARAGARGPRGRAGGGALPRPRQLQVGQRHAGPRRGRPAAHARVRAPAQRHARLRHRGAARRRRVRRAARPRRDRGRRAPGGRPRAREPGAAGGRRGRELLVRASVGVATAGAGGTAAELLRNADVAMYRAKARGKATVEVFAPEMYAAAHDGLALESALAHALDRGELRLAYQPIVELATGRVVGAEALLRWDHPERGPVPPSTFVPLARGRD